MDLRLPYEEDELIVLLKQKELSAIDALYDRYAPAIYTIVLQIVRNKALGNDLVHKTFIVIWCTIDRYEPAKGSLFTWMLQIARNMALHDINASHDQKALNQTSLHREVSLEAGTEIDHLGLRKITFNLGEEHKTLMELYYYKGFTVERIAETLSIPAPAVKTKINAALSEFRNLLCKK